MELIEIEESLKGECCGLGNPIYCEASENQIATNLLRENVKAYRKHSYQRPQAFGRLQNQGERASRPFSFRLHGRDAHAPCPNQKSASKGTLV